MSNYDDLMARAGVSKNQDDAGWRAQRASGVTATNVRDLVKDGASKRKELLEIKTGVREERHISGNQYIDWGNAREPVLGEVLRGAGVEPEDRVFTAAENSRYLASPDGIGEDLTGEIIVGEIKTSKHDLTPGTKEFEATGYYDQMQWQMLVCGATRTLFVWEQHVDFSPLPHKAAWVERDEERIEYLRSVADEFLAEVDGAALFKSGELRSFTAKAKKAAEGAEAEAWIRANLRGRPIKLDIEHRGKRIPFSYSGDKQKPVTKPDAEAAKAAAPDVYAALEVAQAAWDAVLAEHQTTTTQTVKGRLASKYAKEKAA